MKDKKHPKTAKAGKQMDATNGNVNKDIVQKEEVPRQTSKTCWQRVKGFFSIIKEGGTPPKWGLIALAFIALYGSSYSITFIFPFLPEMVLFFGYAEEDKGYYAGMIATSMFAGRIFSSYFWGWLSDRIGRKPVIIICLILVAITNVTFGFSVNIYMAVGIRFLNGLCNGVVGCAKTILYEISDNTNQAAGMAAVSFGWGLGVVSGPLISGYTSSPSMKYPGSFVDVPFLQKYPFFLPSVIAAFVNLLACGVVAWKLPETLKKRNTEEKTIKERKPIFRGNKQNLNSNSLTDLRDRKNPDKSFSVSLDDIDFIDSGENVNDHNQTYGLGVLTTSMGDLLWSKHDLQLSRGQLDDPSGEALLEETGTQEQEVEVKKKGCCSCCDNIHLFRLLRTRDVALTVSLFAIYSYGGIGFDELLTIWASTKVELNGLGFRSDQIGSALGLSAVALLFLQVFIFPKVETRFGAKNTYIFFGYVLIFTSGAMPAIRLLIENNTALWAVLLISLGIQKIAVTTCFSATALMINNSSHPSEAGRVNGIAMTLTAFARTLAPIIGGSIFSWSMKHGYKIGFPFDVNCAFLMFALTFLISNILCAYFPEHLNRQKKSKQQR